MKRAIIRERAALSDTAKVWWLITLFTAFLGAYLGGKEGTDQQVCGVPDNGFVRKNRGYGVGGQGIV